MTETATRHSDMVAVICREWSGRVDLNHRPLGPDVDEGQRLNANSKVLSIVRDRPPLRMVDRTPAGSPYGIRRLPGTSNDSCCLQAGYPILAIAQQSAIYFFVVFSQ